MNLEAILGEYGPMTTSKATQLLQKQGLSSDAARQRVSRRGKNVKILYGLQFPKRARFIYLDSQYGTADYWTALIRSIEETNPAYAAALAGLRARGGVCLQTHFDVVSGSPMKQKGQLASSVVLANLVNVKLVEILEIEGIGTCVSLTESGITEVIKAKRMRARLMTEGVLLDAIRSWAGRMNIASPNVTKIRDEHPEPKFATFRFDLTGPSYLRPMVRFSASKPAPGFLVVDALLGQELDSKMVSAFLRKCGMLHALKKVRPFLPMLVADSFTPDALRLCRAQGIIATSPDTVFGRDVAKALENLLQTLTHVAPATPSQIEGLFKRLSAIEGAAGNLRGAFFELIVGHCVGELEGGSVAIGLIVTDLKNGKRAEIDIRLVKQRVVKVYECKGYQPTSAIRRPEIENWLTEKVPIIYSALKQDDQFSNAEITFEFWTSGSFDTESLELLRTAKASTRKYTIDWKAGTDVHKYAQGLAAPGLRKMLNEHYFNHPLESIRKDDKQQTYEN
jgi:hypothetical protein